MLSVDDPTQVERALRSTIVQLTFDNEKTVWCPATDFFGSGVGLNELHSWYRSVSNDGNMRCRWVMPYQKSAQLTLANVGSQPVIATLHATTAPWQWDARSMHFHTAWHFEAGLKTPPPSDWNYIHINGRGVYVGDTLALFNPVPTWYGEGDEKIWVDGESFPSHMGTGTEDYYNYSYAPRGIIQTPFANQVRIDEPRTQGHNVLTRTRNLDGIPFERALQFDMELISWQPTTLTYAATTYWYAFPGATSNVPPQPHEAALPIPTLADAQAFVAASRPHRAGAIEAENLKVAAQSGEFSVKPQDMALWGAERWSGGEHLVAAATKVGDYIELNVPAPDNAPRQITLYLTQAPDFGTLRFSLNGQAATATFDGYAPQVQPAASLPIGTFTPRDGKFTLRLEVTGTNPKAEGARYYFALDCLTLERANLP